MLRPALALILLTASASAQADDGFVPAALPLALQAQRDVRHTPQPFPGDGDLEFERDGPSGWVVGAGVLGAAGVVSGLVAVAAQARLSSDDTEPFEVPGIKRTRNGAGYSALGLLGGAGLCLVIQIAK